MSLMIPENFARFIEDSAAKSFSGDGNLHRRETHALCFRAARGRRSSPFEDVS
jgi:hypothetical protein